MRRTAGNLMRTVVPCPGALSIVSVPPCKATSRRLMASPSPVPLYLRLIDASAWLKGAHNAANTAGSIPIPVSVTMITKSPSVVHSEHMETRPPRGVNLTALARIFDTTCMIARRSILRVAWAIVHSSCTWFSAAFGLTIATQVRATTASSTLSSARLRSPASILEYSSTLLITFRR